MQKDTEFKHSYIFLNTQFTAQFASTSALHVEVLAGILLITVWTP